MWKQRSEEGRGVHKANLITLSINTREAQSEIMLSNMITGRYDHEEHYATEVNKKGGYCLREQ